MVTTFHSVAAPPDRRGEEFGEAHAERIGATVDGYVELFHAAAPEPVDPEALGNDALELIRAWAPAAAEEIEAIARGAGLPPGIVGAINARTEILGICGRRMRGECSTFLALSTTAAGSFGAQTWDWHDHLADNWLVWTIELPDGRLLHTLTEYGVLGKAGLNSDGVAVMLNILHHRDDGVGMGIPVHVVARRILETGADLNRALTVATDVPVSASTSLTLVGHDGDECSAVCVELTPGGPGVLVPDPDGIFVRTNHFLSSHAGVGDLEPQLGPDSLLRYDVLRRRIAAARPESTEECFAILRSHYGGGGAICAHPDDDADVGSRYATLATTAYDFEQNTMEVIGGGPCSDEAPASFEAPLRGQPIMQGGQ